MSEEYEQQGCSGCGSEAEDNCTHDCGSCGHNCGQPQDLHEPCNPHSVIRHVIGVVSGKGGVGKSMVTSQLAVTMAWMGYRVGILDADITGPSIPKAFGIHERAVGSDQGILPALTGTGIAVMSLNLLTENETDPVVWRGPVIAGAVTQFWTDVQWENVNYMFVDMPPGTGDVPLTVFQSLPVDGIVMVTSPQDLVSMIVTKAVKMAQMMDIPVLGLVENFSYFTCPDCGKKLNIFGTSHADEVAKANNIPLLAQLPIDPELAQACDEGRLEDFQKDYLADTCKMITALIK